MNKEHRLDLIAAAFTLVLGIVLLILTTGVQVKAKNGDVGSAFLPYIVGGLLVALSLIYAVTTLLAIRREPKDQKSEPEEEGPGEDKVKVAISFALLIAYAGLMKPVGFILTSVVYLFCQMNVMAEKPSAKERVLFAALAVIVPIVVSYIFTNLFSMNLPTGLLG